PEVYQWNTDFAALAFSRRIANLGSSLGTPIRLATPSALAVAAFGLDDPDASAPPGAVVIPLFRHNHAETWYALGLNLIATGGDPLHAAIALVPFGTATFPSGPAHPGWHLSVSATGVEGVGVTYRPPNQLTVGRI